MTLTRLQLRLRLFSVAYLAPDMVCTHATGARVIAFRLIAEGLEGDAGGYEAVAVGDVSTC